MKLTNLELAIGLADTVLQAPHPRRDEILQLADYLATHPTSSVFYERALLELGIEPHTIPTEAWGTTIPQEGEGAAGMKEAIAYLNRQWHKGKLQRRVAVRALAWAATLLARRLDADCTTDCESIVQRNGGNTAGLFKQFIQQTATRAELQAQVIPSSTENQHEQHPATAA